MSKRMVTSLMFSCVITLVSISQVSASIPALSLTPRTEPQTLADPASGEPEEVFEQTLANISEMVTSQIQTVGTLLPLFSESVTRTRRGDQGYWDCVVDFCITTTTQLATMTQVQYAIFLQQQMEIRADMVLIQQNERIIELLEQLVEGSDESDTEEQSEPDHTD